MTFIGTCAEVSLKEWNDLMRGKKRFSYKTLCKMVKDEYPKMYVNLSLDLYNPWSKDTYQTKTHYILTHSATEYFFLK